MEERSVDFDTPEDGILMHFHFRSADNSPHNTASTNAHMEVMFKKLPEQGLIEKGNSTLSEFTDCFSKHYMR